LFSTLDVCFNEALQLKYTVVKDIIAYNNRNTFKQVIENTEEHVNNSSISGRSEIEALCEGRDRRYPERTGLPSPIMRGSICTPFSPIWTFFPEISPLNLPGSTKYSGTF